jgi:hypothetical protein
MRESARDRAASDDQAAHLNEQVAEGHERAAHAVPDGKADLHSDAATKYGGPLEKIAPKPKPPEMKPDEQTD